MIVERAFQTVHNLNIPENKRKHWPPYSEVIVDMHGNIQDIYQYFNPPTEQQICEALSTYPGCVSFPVRTDKFFNNFDEFAKKVSSSAELASRTYKNERSLVTDKQQDNLVVQD